MSKNLINEYIDENTLLDKLKTLEGNLREFKSGVQGPTISVTSVSVVTGQLFGSFSDAGGVSPQFNALATITPPGNRYTLAIPEIALFNGLVLNAANLFPDGSFFGTSLNPAVYIKLKYWLEYQSSFGRNQLNALLNTMIDGALYDAASPPWSGNTFTLAVRWRYFVKGSS